VELRRLGTSGLRLSALSLGAMLFGASQALMKGVTSSEEGKKLNLSVTP
jgi:aryl-alcohol dehydrogenase-like predicted oxidoreductase